MNVGAGIAWTTLRQNLQTLFGFVRAVGLQVGESQHLVGDVGLHLEVATRDVQVAYRRFSFGKVTRFLQVRDTFLELRLLVQDIAFDEAQQGVILVQRQSVVACLLTFSQVLLQEVATCQVLPRVDVVGINVQRLLQYDGGFGIIVGVNQVGTDATQGFGIVPNILGGFRQIGCQDLIRNHIDHVFDGIDPFQRRNLILLQLVDEYLQSSIGMSVKRLKREFHA